MVNRFESCWIYELYKLRPLLSPYLLNLSIQYLSDPRTKSHHPSVSNMRDPRSADMDRFGHVWAQHGVAWPAFHAWLTDEPWTGLKPDLSYGTWVAWDPLVWTYIVRLYVASLRELVGRTNTDPCQCTGAYRRRVPRPEPGATTSSPYAPHDRGQSMDLEKLPPKPSKEHQL